MDAMILNVKKMYPDAKIPQYQREGDAALDLYAYEEAILHPGEWKTIKTGIAMEIPENHFGSIRDRSGMAAKYAVHTMAGVVDENYRGDVGVVLINLGKEPYSIQKFDRIAQMVIKPILKVKVQEVQELQVSVRSDSGFGSTGLR